MTEELTQTMDDTIASEWDRISGEIHADEPENTAFSRPEKVAETPPTDDAAPDVADSDDTATTPETSKAMPAAWRKEMQEEWTALSERAKDEVLKRESDVRNGFNNYKAKAELGTRFEEVAKPYEQFFKQHNVTPEHAAGVLFRADSALRFGTQEQKTAMARKLFADYKIDPVEVFGVAQEDANTADPRIANFEQRLAQHEQDRAQQAEYAARQEHTEVLNTLAAFAYEIDASTGQPKTRGTDEYGNPVLSPKAGREHFETVRNVMAGLIQGEPSLTLEEAYDRAVYALPTTRQALLATQQAEQRAEEKRKAQAAKDANAVNIRARGTVASKAAVGSMDSTIADEAKRLGLIN